MGYPKSSLEGLWNMEHPMLKHGGCGGPYWAETSSWGLSSSVPRRVTSGQTPCVRGWRRKKEESKRFLVLPEKIQKNPREMGQIGAFLWCDKNRLVLHGGTRHETPWPPFALAVALVFQSLAPRMICQWEFVVFCDGEIKVPHIHCKINSPQNPQKQ